MSDLISRQAAIDVLKQLQKSISGDYTELDPLVMAGCGYIGDCIGELECLPSAQPQRWILVSEALPEKKTEVIYSLENHFVSTGYMTDRNYNGDETKLHWEDMESGALIYPEAWMPLPEPYMRGEL